MAKKQIGKESKTVGDTRSIKIIKEKLDNAISIDKFLAGLGKSEMEETPLNTYSNGDDIDDFDDEEDYISQSHTEDISFIELAIINDYLHDSYRGKHKDVTVSSYGQVDSIGRISFGGVFDITSSFWFTTKIKGDDNDFIFQTKTFVDNRNELVTQLHFTVKKGMVYSKFEDMFKKIKTLAFNNSQYKGKCIKVKLREGTFRGIEIINFEPKTSELILNETQTKFIEHFINRVGRGGNVRYLLNGPPGSGKTQSIRDIACKLMPKVTFVIPDFTTSDDLTSIMEACEIFDNGVIVIDDIDLYLGSRDNGSYTRLLGQFLSFFDGIKKRKISLVCSTNDKKLCDAASSRPGRMNIILDFDFLNPEQIIKVCNIHLDKKWQIKEVYDVLTGKVNGMKTRITGAFIYNLGENIREMSEGDKNWKLSDTISLIEQSYMGFYNSQISNDTGTIGFKTT